MRKDTIWFLGRDGLLVGRALADGAPVVNIPLGVPPTGGPIAAGDDLAVPVGLGIIRLLTIESNGGKP